MDVLRPHAQAVKKGNYNPKFAATNLQALDVLLPRILETTGDANLVTLGGRFQANLAQAEDFLEAARTVYLSQTGTSQQRKQKRRHLLDRFEQTMDNLTNVGDDLLDEISTTEEQVEEDLQRVAGE